MMNKIKNKNQEEELVNIITGYRKSALLYTLLSTGVFESIGSESLTFDKLLSKLDIKNKSRLYRLLDMAESLNFIRFNDNLFQLTELTHTLMSNRMLKDWALCELQPLYWGLWSELPRSLDNDQTPFHSKYGENFFEFILKKTDIQSLFQRTMSNLSKSVTKSISDKYDFSPYKKWIDIGGGDGSLIRNISKNYSAQSLAVFDLPSVFNQFRNISENHERKIHFVPGSFLEKINLNGDLIILKNILHDWSDRECEKILKNCINVLDKKGKILIVEMVKDQYGQGSKGKGLDILMMLLFDGKERTYDEFRLLGQKVGLSLVREIKLDGPQSILEFEVLA